MEYNSKVEIVDMLLNMENNLINFNNILKDDWFIENYGDIDIIDRFESEIVPYNGRMGRGVKNILKVDMFLTYDGDEYLNCDDLYQMFNIDTAWWEYDIIPKKVMTLANLTNEKTKVVVNVYNKDGSRKFCENRDYITESLIDDIKSKETQEKLTYDDLKGLTDEVIHSMTEKDLEILEQTLYHFLRYFRINWDHYYETNEKVYERRKNRDTDPIATLTNDEYDDLMRIRRNAQSYKNELTKNRFEKEGNELLPIFIKFLEIDKKMNPKLYPDWLKLDVKEKTNWGEIVIYPTIDLNAFLKQEGSFREMRNIKHRIQDVWNRYVKSGRPLRLQQIGWDGLDEYIKKVFRKEIRAKIKDLPYGGCIHSVIFRARNSWNDVDIQIYPRLISRCRSWYSSPNGFNEYTLHKEIKDLLKEYGWYEGRNYTFSGDKD